jgi:hypothetical protein
VDSDNETTIGRASCHHFSDLLTSFRVREEFIDHLPVHDIPPRIDVIRTLVLILQVVGVFPHVAAEERNEAVHEWAILVRLLDRLNRGCGGIPHQPAPTAAELRQGVLLERVLELREVAERRRDRFADRAGRFAARIRRHDCPEQSVVVVSAAVVDDGLANAFWHSLDVAKQAHDVVRRRVRRAFERFVEVIDIRFVVTLAVNFHRHRVDVRFEGFEVVGQSWQCVCHGAKPREGTNAEWRHQPLIGIV